MERIPGPGREKNKQKIFEEWENVLVKEGMPAEILSADVDHEEHTPAYAAAVRELVTHFLHGEVYYGAHRTKAQEILEQLKSGGASQTEIQHVAEGMDDFAREVENISTQLQAEAMKVGNEILEKNRKLKARPEQLAKLIVKEMRDFEKEHAVIAAEMAAEKLCSPMQ